ncbi:MAG: Rab family GTPase, partial [Candidatus Hodarchaeota archaeon]
MPKPKTKAKPQAYLKAKLVLLGDGAVGKTALRKSFMGETITEQYIRTIGAAFSSKMIIIKRMRLAYQIWDLAGQEHFNVVRPFYYKGAAGGILVYDITREQTLYNLKNWIQEFFSNVRNKQIPLVMLGNKIDLKHTTNFTVSTEQAIEYAKTLEDEFQCEFPISFLETSAKTG